MVNTFENACVVKDKVYFFSYEVNGLFKIDMNKRECSYIASLEKYSSKIRLFGDLTYINGKLVIAPMSADDFVIYDLEMKSVKYLPIQNPEKHNYINNKFFTVVPFEEYVYFIGHWYPAIVKLDLATEEITYYDDWIKEIENIEEDFFRHNYCIKDENIILPCSRTNKVMMFNTKNGKYNFLNIASQERKYAGIIYDGTNYWLTPRYDNIVVKCNFDTGNYEEFIIEENGKEFIQRELSYGQSFLVGQYIVILPLYDYPICVIDTTTGSLKTISSEWAIKKDYLMVAPIRGGFVYQNQLYVSNSYNSELYILDFHDFAFKKIGLNTSDVFKYCSKDKSLLENLKIDFGKEILFENTERDLDSLILGLDTNKRRLTPKRYISVGNKIWNELTI